MALKKQNCQNTTLVSLLVLMLVASMASAQKAPPGIDEISHKFNLDNAVEKLQKDVADEDDYGIAQYQKSKTQFDGVTSEMQVTYLNLVRDQGVEIPVLSTGSYNQNTDFTVMMWFKIGTTFNEQAQPVLDDDDEEEAEKEKEIQLMYLFSFEDSAACFFTDSLTLMCDSWDRRKLQVSANTIVPGVWYHLTLSSSAEGESFLLIQSHAGIVAEDRIQNFGFRQNTVYGWKSCLGDCISDYGIVGAIREVVMFAKTVTKEQAMRAKSRILTYDSSIKCYFRFQDHRNKFEKDEFVDWPWLRFKNMPENPEDYVGADIIPNDVCPSIFDQISALHFSKILPTRIRTFEFQDQLPQNQYSYTMSITLQVNETACTQPSPSGSDSNCNLMELDGVFMLYMMGRNTARFHFFASKNYYESASSMIYIPYDQWITIQLSLDRFDGYQIVVCDRNGNAFYRTRVQQNMQEQWPSNRLNVLKAFEGYVEHFYLADSFKALNPYYATNFRNDSDALINVHFLEENLKEHGFINLGRSGGYLKLIGGSENALFEKVFFQVPSEGGNVAGTIDDVDNIFDGIACNDKHMTTYFNDEESFITFSTPELSEWSKENTIEFWFKLENPKLYSKSISLFSMSTNESNSPALYYQVYIERGSLKCAPFGNQSQKDPIIVLTEFKQENEDMYGWWHVSCSYYFQQVAQGTIFNSNVFQTLDETMIGLPKFYPTNSLKATFGKHTSPANSYGSAGVLVKEFRFWNRQQSFGDLSNNRYRQIDPTKLSSDLLLIYLRLATGSHLIENFALRGKKIAQTDLALQTSGLSFVEDFIETERYKYDVELDLVVQQKLRTYHTVCPVHTYFMDQYCYNEPVNKAVLGIFPQWNQQFKRVDWQFTLMYSSMIQKDVVQYLTESFSSNDKILNSYLAKKSNAQQLDYLIPANVLRHESEYSVSAALTNDERTFYKEHSVKFVPSKCKWFTAIEGGATQGYMIFEETPGTKDISFQLQLQRNRELDCSQFDFFDTFNGLGFEFIMTDTDQYISYIPKMQVSAYNGANNQDISPGEKAPEGMIVNVVMPALEQSRLPVFQDIMIMLSVHWTSSQSWDINLTEDLTFQNILYMIKFEPVANVLYASLVASQSEVIRDETLVLDASGSSISNMPAIAQRRSLAYDWKCPQELADYCSKQAGDQLAIPFDIVKKNSVMFETPYTFEVTVVWAKADGQDEKQTLTAEVTFYDLAMPEYTIEYDPAHTLITSDQNALFYLEAINFAIDDVYQYDVVWNLEPKLKKKDNQQILSGGRVMQILKGSFETNTSYKLTLSVTSKKLVKLSDIKTVEFKTLAPPVGGSVQINPLQGYIGETFTVSLNGWTSANLPIEYNVYTSIDQSGERKGALINQSGSIPVAEEFSFVAQRTSPIIVTVFDASGETLEYTLNPQILAQPEASSSEESADPASSNNDPPESTEPPSPQSLLIQISNSKTLRQRVNYMSLAIKTVSRLDPQTETSESQLMQQINFRKQLMDELQNQVSEFSARDKNDPLYMTARDFLIESFAVLVELTAIPKYLDQDIVDKCTQVIFSLSELDNGLLFLTLEAEQQQFILDYFFTLENLNRYARLNNVEVTLQWVRYQLEKSLNEMCNWIDLPETYEYNSYMQELGFSLFRFDQQTALKAQRGVIRALDATYDYNAFRAYGWFTASQPGQLCLQLVGQQFGTVLMDGAYIGNSRARLSVKIYEKGTGITHPMGELSGQNIATFDLDQSTYHSNQTVCMSYEEKDKIWKSDLCQWELYEEFGQMKCTCNAFNSEMFGIFTDFTRTLGAPVAFPPPAEPTYTYNEKERVFGDDKRPYVDVSTFTNPSESNTKTSQVSQENAPPAGTNFVWMGQSIMFSILTLTGAIVTRKMDQKDSKTQGLARTSPIPVAKQNHFISEVANSLKEPYAAVYLRKQSVMYYRTIFSKSAFPHLMSQLHPLISPFTSFYATQSRLMRFAIYLLQFNIISFFVFIYYAAIYRSDDKDRNPNVVEGEDISAVIGSTLLCSFFLTPWLSEPLIKTCSNQLVALASPNSANLTQPVAVKTRRSLLRKSILILALITSLILPIWAMAGSGSVAASSQYCMATTMIGSTFISTLGTNLIYLWLNSVLARRIAYSQTGHIRRRTQCSDTFVHFRALQIVRDMKAVNEIKDQFTLADVLPSSIECSGERSVCSHHSSNLSRQHQSQNLSKQLEPIHEMTINAEANSEEVIDEPEHHQTIEMIPRRISEEGKELIDEEDSQRAFQQQKIYDNELLGNVDESSKQNLIASMLKESLVELDNSRNDVVPQRTQMDTIEPELQARIRIHPETAKLGIGINNEPGSSFDQSDSIQSDKRYRSALHHGPRDRQSESDESDSPSDQEDNEAELERQGKPQLVSLKSTSNIPLTKKPKVILQ